MRKLQTYLVSALVSAGLLLGPVMPAAAQNRGRNDQQRGQNDNYYSGMQQSVRKGNYARDSRNDQRGHRQNGGIGPGKAAVIGGAGGAALGAVFGGSLESTLIGGAAGAGIAAIIGEASKGNDHNRDHGRGHR